MMNAETTYKIQLHPADSWYNEKHLIEGKEFVKEDDFARIFPGHTFRFKNKKDVAAFKKAGYNVDRITLHIYSTVIPQA